VQKILVVDDEGPIRRALALNLAARDYRVDFAETEAAAVHAAATLRPDLVLLDLGLSDIDGIALIEAMRRCTSVPIIVLTARGDERSRSLALDAGADHSITKPFGIDQLLARIRSVLGPRHPADAP
jgi:two-component system KDP operon response regulator KdpE